MRRTTAAAIAVAAGAALVAGLPATADAGQSPAPKTTTLADGLVSPLSVAVAHNGTVYVTQDFAGLVTAIPKGGTPQVVYAATGGASVSGVSVKGKKVTFAETGADGEYAVVKRLGPGGNATTLADVRAYEHKHNPDGNITYGFRGIPKWCAKRFPADFPAVYKGILDAHPYATTAGPGGSTYVADAGANAIFKVSKKGRVSTVAVVPAAPTFVTKAMVVEQGLPRCAGNRTYWFEGVPTGVVVGPRGALWVTSLPGGPEDPSFGARGSVLRIDPASGRTTRVVRDLMSPTSLTFGPDGALYVAELFGNQISRIAKGSHVAVPYLQTVMPAGLTANRWHLFATTGALIGDDTTPPGGAVVKITPRR